MQKYFGTRIADLLPRINREIFIPSIQRPYVWETDQIVRLFDSLMRGYPINTFLFWELQPEHFGDWDIYRFVRNFRQGDTHNDPADLSTGVPLTLVLDGQQRLTSLLIALMGSYHVRNGKRGRAAAYVEQVLQLNLLEAPHEDSDDEDDAPIKDLHYGFKFVNAETPPKSSSKAVWFPVSHITRITNRDQLAAMIDHLSMLHEKLNDEQRGVMADNLRRLYEVVHEEECLAYYMEKEQSYDKVLDIFIRANDGGTRLTKADMLMSMVTLRWDQFNARDETDAITTFLRDTLQQETAFGRDYLLRSGLFFNDLKFGFQLRNFTPRNIAIIESRWQEVKLALRTAAEAFARYGIVGSALTGPNAVMLIALFVFKLNAQKPLAEWSVDADNAERIRRWIISVLFHGVMGGTANVTMDLYRRIISKSLQASGRFPAPLLVEQMTARGKSMNFTDEVLGRFISQPKDSRLGELCLSLLYDRSDWSDDDYQIVAVMPSHRLHNDRLHAQGILDAEIAQMQSWSDRLVNLCLMTGEESRHYHSLDFEDWVVTLSPDFVARHHLPADRDLYAECHFLTWIATRRDLIAQRMQVIYQIDAQASTDTGRKVNDLTLADLAI